MYVTHNIDHSPRGTVEHWRFVSFFWRGLTWSRLRYILGARAAIFGVTKSLKIILYTQRAAACWSRPMLQEVEL
jgi:hypothetical protein